jgi:hypothetical protein
MSLRMLENLARRFLGDSQRNLRAAREIGWMRIELENETIGTGSSCPAQGIEMTWDVPSPPPSYFKIFKKFVFGRILGLPCRF